MLLLRTVWNTTLYSNKYFISDKKIFLTLYNSKLMYEIPDSEIKEIIINNNILKSLNELDEYIKNNLKSGDNK